ncbi:MAG TPA: pseudouridine-5'-phosphate glycosidase [Pyrinomonadaceae bacterium]|nr:pseudouridine-5'-phosphate glycosidase [Pyrinomonadaceae bacterium]
MITPKFLHLSGEVETAISSGKPVVALESTVIAHGLPRPKNLETARRLESIVRTGGAVPATIAVLGGKLCAGLTETQIELIASSDNIKKVSTRDLAIAVSQKWDGATTVASTIWIANKAGIKVTATGGIGGVHRGELLDISADLPELARTPIVVVCSGAKIVLDLPATREWLETQGVPVIGYQCDDMPAFYSRASGLKIDATADSPATVVDFVRTQRALGIQSAILVTVPVPKEAEVAPELLENVLADAIKEAERRSIAGSDLTPFLLSRMAEQSNGATLRANIALLENNARVAAEISLELAANSPRETETGRREDGETG